MKYSTCSTGRAPTPSRRGNRPDPTLSFRGVDNQAYYRLVDGDPQYYFDTTGTGNSFNVRHHESLRLIMDSLRYWVTDMHVDGFRFDLASALAREFHSVSRLAAFFDLVNQDPVVSQVKLIAEPWDVGEGGYQVGGFPPLWTEWNGRYRDTVRDFWRGEPASLAELASRFTRSSDLYESDGRRPLASINFVTAHDGFTLWGSRTWHTPLIAVIGGHRPDFRRSQAHVCLIDRVRAGQGGAVRSGTCNRVGTRLWVCRWT
jgi:isoamylase